MDLMPQIRKENVIENNEEKQEIILSPKQKISQGEIFQGLSQEKEIMTHTPIIEKNEEKIEEEDPNFIHEPEQKNDKIIDTPPKKERKKRPPMTEEHKEKLAQARVKALATRRANAKQKNEIKELKQLQKNQELQKLRQTVLGSEAPPPPIPKVRQVIEEYEKTPEQPKEHTYTKKELIEAQQHAVLQYEKIRLDKKAHKKKIQAEQMEIEKQQKEKDMLLKRSINRAINPQPRTRHNNRDNWDNCL